MCVSPQSNPCFDPAELGPRLCALQQRSHCVAGGRRRRQNSLPAAIFAGPVGRFAAVCTGNAHDAKFSGRCPGKRRRQSREFVRTKQRTLGHEQGISRRPVMAHESFAHALRSDPGSGAESRERDDVGMQRGKCAMALRSKAGTAEPKPTPMIGVSARLPAFHSSRSGTGQKIPSRTSAGSAQTSLPRSDALSRALSHSGAAA